MVFPPYTNQSQLHSYPLGWIPSTRHRFPPVVHPDQLWHVAAADSKSDHPPTQTTAQHRGRCSGRQKKLCACVQPIARRIAILRQAAEELLALVGKMSVAPRSEAPPPPAPASWAEG